MRYAVASSAAGFIARRSAASMQSVGLSHVDAGALQRILRATDGPVHVTVRSGARTRPGIRVHRRPGMRADEVTVVRGIPVTTALATLIDLAASLPDRRLEAAVNEADKLGLVGADRIPALVAAVPPRPGIGRLRKIASAHHPSDSDLERVFLRLTRRVGMLEPQTQAVVNGYRVDFYWPELKLVVEVDGLTYHRTASQQAEDRRRDQAHTAAGLTPLRFTDAQVRRDKRHVERTLLAVVSRRTTPAPSPSGPGGGARNTPTPRSSGTRR